MVEVIIVGVVLALAMGIYSSTVLATTRMRQIARGNAVAVAAARTILELMRDVRFEDVFASFNADPSDDPDGLGTAPGATFPVPGLNSLPGVEDSVRGEIVFPVVPVQGTELQSMLSEQYQDRRMGMPRDLNGDSRIDGERRDDDYRILPVLVRVTWCDRSGDRETRLYSMLAGFQW